MLDSSNMKLLDLNIGEIGVIKDVFVKNPEKNRLGELGFIPGEIIEVIFKSQSNSKIICRIKNYEIVLNDYEANLIEVVKQEEIVKKTGIDCNNCNRRCFSKYTKSLEPIQKIKVALVGNPNCGKTTLFNFVSYKHEHIGNFANVTVDIKAADIIFENYNIQLVDLPGTYSLNSDNNEEKCTVDYIFEEKPDVIINVLDSTKLERSLYLTTQLMKVNTPVVCAFNFFDKFEKYDFKINLEKFKNITNIDAIPIISDTGFGIKRLFDKVIEIFNENKIENINSLEDIENISFKENINPTIAENYQKVNDILQMSEYSAGSEKQKITMHVLDKMFLHKYFGLVIFGVFITSIFFSTFYLGQIPTNFLNFIIDKIVLGLEYLIPNCVFKDLLLNGIISGVGSAIVFIPQIFILYVFIIFFEESGYISRATLLIDRLMHKIGLHAESFIPLISGFGCNVPAILLTKTIKNKKNKIITALIIPMMSCPAKLPVYVLLGNLFFSPYIKTFVICGIYFFGICVGIICSKLLNVFMKDSQECFINEIQDYRFPSLFRIFKDSAHKCTHFLKNIGSVIVVASIFLWVLGYFPHDNNLTREQQLKQSYIGIFGKKIEPLFKPIGLNWKLSIPIVAGVGAKEVIAPSVMSFYKNEETQNDEKKIKMNMEKDGINIGVIISFLIFVLLYFPCLGTLAAINKELGIKYAILSLFLNTGLAYFCSFIFFNLYILFSNLFC